MVKILLQQLRFTLVLTNTEARKAAANVRGAFFSANMAFDWI
jgi:hypothetical protein